MNKTAMQEFFMVLKQFNKELYNTMSNEGILDTALEKEKEHIKEAWYNGGINGMGLFETNTGEEYYNQKFGQAGRTFTQDLIPKK